MVQAVFLYREELWRMKEDDLRNLVSFHHRVIQHNMGALVVKSVKLNGKKCSCSVYISPWQYTFKGNRVILENSWRNIEGILESAERTGNHCWACINFCGRGKRYLSRYDMIAMNNLVVQELILST